MAVDKYDCIISTQVLNEFSNVCIGKLHIEPEKVEKAVKEMIEQCTVLLIEKENIEHAIQIHKKFKYNYFDCLMIVSALNSDCKYFITEDMADGQVIENKLTLVNIYKENNVKKYLEE